MTYHNKEIKRLKGVGVEREKKMVFSNKTTGTKSNIH
jgi:hypothetical protein